MSNNTYTMKLVVDDTAIKDLERRMGSIFGNVKGSGASTGSSSANPIKNLMKLGAISAGIGTLVYTVKKIMDLTVDASPMLKGMLQLFNNSVMFILRPIGDFIGYMLKPIMIYFLRYVAVPFYKHFAPWMQKYGTKVGDAMLGILTFLTTGKTPTNNPVATVTLSLNPATASGMVADWLKTSLGQYFDSGSANYIFKGIDFSTITSVWSSLTSMFQGIGAGMKPLISAWDKLFVWFSSIGIGIKPLVTAWDKLFSWFSGIGGGMKTLLNVWDKFYAWIAPMGSTISNIFVKAWDALTAFWKQVQDFLKDPAGTIAKAAGGNNNPLTAGFTPRPANYGKYGSGTTVIGTPTININIDKAMGDVSKWGQEFEQAIASAIQNLTNKGAVS